jgi:MFS family permease
MPIFKLWYLAFFSASSCLYPFLNLIFRRHAGLTEAQLGTLGALRPWLGLPAGAILSGVADKWRLHRAVLLVAFVLFSGGRLAVAAARSFPAVLALMLFSDACGAPVTIIADAAAMAACPGEGEYARQRLFGAVGWGIFSAVAGAALDASGAPAAFVLNAALSALALVPTALLPFEALHAKLGRQHEHGDGRSPKGVAVGVEAAAELRTSAELERRHVIAAGSGADAERGGTDAVADDGPKASPPPVVVVHYWRGVATLLSNPDALLFFCIAVVFGYAVGSIEGFLFLFLEDLGAPPRPHSPAAAAHPTQRPARLLTPPPSLPRTGGSDSLMGLTLSVTCVAETAVFWHAGALLRLLGPHGATHLCFAAFLLRLACYAALPAWGSPWLVLPVELLHGLTFGLTWAAGTARCAELAPPGLEATSQSMFQGLLFGVGHGMGGLVGGRVYQTQGPVFMYALAFCVVAAGWGATSAAGWALRRRRRRSARGGGYAAVPAVAVEMAVGGAEAGLGAL